MHAETMLQRMKITAAVGIEGDDLAVKNNGNVAHAKARDICSNSGYSRVTSRPERAHSVVLPFSICAMARTPSHLISNTQLGLENGLSPSSASVARTPLGILGIGVSIAPGRADGSTARRSREAGRPSRMSSTVRPLTTDSACCSTSHFASTKASRCLISSHSFLLPGFFSFTRTKLPRSFSPLS